MRKIFFVAATAVTFVALVLGNMASARNLELADYLNFERTASPQLSPDGKRIVYTRQRVNKLTDSVDSEVWQMTADGKRNRFLLKGGAAKWSPGGDRLAYIGVADDKPQLFVRWMDAEGSVSQITHDVYAPNQFAWSPDGEWIAFRAQVPMAPGFTITLPGRVPGAKWTEDPPVIDRMHYRGDRVGMKTGFDHLFVVPASGGTARQLTKGNWDVGRRFSGMDTEMFGAFQWTPDGKYLVFSGEMDPEEEVSGWSSQIHRIEVASGEIETLMDDAGSWGIPQISPGGNLIAYIGAKPRKETWPISELRVMNADGTNSRVLLEGLDAPFFPIKWAENGKGLYYNYDREGANNINYVNLEGESRNVSTGDHLVSLDSFVGRTGVGVYTSPQVTHNLVKIDLRDGSLKQLTDVNADILVDVELGNVEEIWYDSSDNTRVQGWIVTPPDFDPKKKYPMLLQIHGGPNGMYNVGFNFSFQEFAARGYVVLYTNPRGSTGYGEEFTHAINFRYPGRRDFDDLMAGVDAVIDRGYIDEERLYVAGCSGGGALTAWIVGHTDRFAAAASLCTVTNWISMAGTADVAGWANKQFAKPFWEDPTPWLEHSPLMHVGKVTTPTLLMTGDLDLRTPMAQAEAFYSALKYRGIPTLLIPIKNEWHGTTTIPSNLLRTHLYMQKWFDEHGGGASGNTEEGSDAGD